jgi:hypothetical protein
MPDKIAAKRPDPLLYLGGQMNALLAFVAASIQSHPNRAELRASFERGARLQEAKTLNAEVSDDYLRGQQETTAGILQLFDVLEKAEKKKAPGSDS